MRKMQAATEFVNRYGRDFVNQPWFVKFELRHIPGHQSERLCLIIRPAAELLQGKVVRLIDLEAAEKDRQEAQAMLDAHTHVLDECLREMLKDRPGFAEVTAAKVHFQILIVRDNEVAPAEPLPVKVPHDHLVVPPPDPSDGDV